MVYAPVKLHLHNIHNIGGSASLTRCNDKRWINAVQTSDPLSPVYIGFKIE